MASFNKLKPRSEAIFSVGSGHNTAMDTPTVTDLQSCTIKDVASLSGVSTATVSRVVNGSSSVSRKTKRNVLSAISTLEYRPNAHASELGRANAGIPKKRSDC